MSRIQHITLSYEIQDYLLVLPNIMMIILWHNAKSSPDDSTVKKILAHRIPFIYLADSDSFESTMPTAAYDNSIV